MTYDQSVRLPPELPEPEAFAPVGRLAHHLLNVPTCFVTMLDLAGAPVTFLLDTQDRVVEPNTLSRAVADLAMTIKTMVVISDTHADPRLLGLTSTEEGCACLAQPLFDFHGHIAGAFGVIDLGARLWTDQDRTNLSDLATFAIAEIERREAVRTRATMDHSTERLYQLAKALTAASGIDEILHRTSVIAGEIVGASFANLAIVDAEQGELQLYNGMSIGHDLSEQWSRIRLDTSTPLGQSVMTGMPVHIGSPGEMAIAFPLGADDAARAGLQALAAYPTRRGRGAIGFAWSHPIDFSGPLLTKLATVTELVGLGLERATTSDRDRDVADRLQRSLLPRELVPIPGVRTETLYEAGTADLQVGGDWYDIVAAGPDRYVIGIGDVVGRGLRAAVTMGELRHAFTAFVSDNDSLDVIVQKLDQFSRNIDGAWLSTMIVASYEPSTSRLDLISAGHMPPMIHRRGRSVVQLPDGGPPIGLDNNLERSTMQTSLAIGDSLWLYTDGLIERRGESIDVGLARLQEAINLNSGSENGSALHQVYDALGRPTFDDVAIVVLSR